MPIKLWTTEADFNDFDLTTCEADPAGKVIVSAGETEGVAISPVYEALNWQGWNRVRATFEQPDGTGALIQFRSGATAEDCAGADWSEYFDAADDNGVVMLAVGAYYENNPLADVGAFIQFRVTLQNE